MTDHELERAATAPFRWTVLSCSKDRGEDGNLPVRMARSIDNLIGTLNAPPRHEFLEPEDFTNLYLVPGGRYLVIDGKDCLSVWDLGYVSDDDAEFANGEPNRMWTTEVNDIEDFLVHPTPDGQGIRIFTYASP
jgi:hypothetical protein